jgi:hypothetical protein
VRLQPWKIGEKAWSCRAAFVPVMKATQVRNSHDVAVGRRRDRSREGDSFVERQVRPGSQVVPHVRSWTRYRGASANGNASRSR